MKANEIISKLVERIGIYGNKPVQVNIEKKHLRDEFLDITAVVDGGDNFIIVAKITKKGKHNDIL